MNFVQATNVKFCKNDWRLHYPSGGIEGGEMPVILEVHEFPQNLEHTNEKPPTVFCLAVFGGLLYT